MLRCVTVACASLLVGSSRVVRKTDDSVEQILPFLDDLWGKGDTFWGIPLDANPSIFVIDKSNSMSKTATQGFSFSGGTMTRDQASYQELSRSLNLLLFKWFYSFNVITFANEVKPVFPDVTLATLGNVSAALQQAAGGLALQTNTYEALRVAYASPTAPQKIYLLSDGLPTRKGTPFKGRQEVMDGILRDVKAWDKGRGIKLNTILLNGQGAEKDDQARSFMARLAAESGGVFMDVPF